MVGKSHSLSAAEEGQFLIFTAPLKGLTSGISLRDKHMKERYLEVEKYPNAELRVEKSSLLLPKPGTDGKSKGTGKLTLHNVTREVSFTYRVKSRTAVDEVSVEMPLNFNDYGVQVPNYLGITLKPNVVARVAFKVPHR